MKKKINLLYNAEELIESKNHLIFRTGIYFVAFNVLRILSLDKRFSIVLYSDKITNNQKYFKDDFFLSQFPIYSDRNEKFKSNINTHKNNLKINRNIYKKLICFLKIIKNSLLLLKSSFIRNKYCLEDFDIFFSPWLIAPISITKLLTIKYFIVLYDAIPNIFPQYFPDINDDNHQYNRLTKSINKNTYYFCISNSTKNDFLSFYEDRFDKNKVFVTHLASSQNFFPDYDKVKLTNTIKKYFKEYENMAHYIFSFCTLEPRKNLLFTVRCFIKFIQKHKINDLFFFLGGTSWDFFVKQLQELLNDFSDYKDKIVQLGYIDDKDVNILYSNSLFFVYLSQYEGFGLPPLEAMQAGTPVICSNNSSLPEVVGDAAVMIDYSSEEQCIEAFEKFYFNSALRDDYIKRGLEHAKMFTWEKTVNIMSNAMIEAVGDI
jgi:glycosyltransferase involved in cell wall biosynthesis